MAKKAIIVGASGLIGSYLLDILLAQPDYEEILIVARKKTKTKNTKINQLIIDFEKLDDYADHITGDVLFCCLGTTRNATPDLDLYRKIDHGYPVKLAETALRNNIEQYHFVSAIGANSASSNFYTKIKGEAEDDIKKIGLKSLYIYQPSLLIGARNKVRLAESMAAVLMKIIKPLLIGRLRKYRAIKALDVAKAMYKQSLKNKAGVHIYTTDKIQRRA